MRESINLLWLKRPCYDLTLRQRFHAETEPLLWLKAECNDLTLPLVQAAVAMEKSQTRLDSIGAATAGKLRFGTEETLCLLIWASYHNLTPGRLRDLTRPSDENFPWTSRKKNFQTSTNAEHLKPKNVPWSRMNLFVRTRCLRKNVLGRGCTIFPYVFLPQGEVRL